MKKCLLIGLCMSMLLVGCTKSNTAKTKDAVSSNTGDIANSDSIKENVEEGIDKNTNQEGKITDNNSGNTNKTGDNTESNKNHEYRVFYYNGVLDKIYYTTPNITGDIKSDISILENMLKQEVATDLLYLDDSLKVNNVVEHGDYISIDLSSSIYNMLSRFGGSSELGLLHSIAYTYGYNYGVNKVTITVDNKPYMGGHVILEEGDYITINLDNVEPAKR